jgi:CDP-6-deoxy-D-xylo-4-hexulose-3-dehydrase
MKPLDANASGNWPLMANNINESDRQALIRFLEDADNRLTHGPKVTKFEQLWAEWLGVKHAVFVNSGASANDLSMLIVRELYGEGEVIVPPLTWVSDIASVLHARMTPRFVDINLRNLALNPDGVRVAITDQTKAIFLTHVLGLNGLGDEIWRISQERGIPIIEDVCESHGATWNGKKVGTFGVLSNFSFYYAHHMTTIEGGMICTDSDEVYALARMMRSHGLVREIGNASTQELLVRAHSDLNHEFIFHSAGHNMRPTELGAVLGINQLPRLDRNIELRNRNFEYFLSLLDQSKYMIDFDLSGSSNYALIVVMREEDLDRRDLIEKTLRNANIEFRRGLSGGGNQTRQPYLKKYKIWENPRDYPVADRVHSYAWYIGNYPELQLKSIDRLCGLLNSC